MRNHNSRLAALFILLAALLLAAGCSRSSPESAGTAGPTQTSAAATDASRQSGDATSGTASPESATPSPDAPVATDGTSAAGSASPDGTTEARNGAAGSSSSATGSASATSGGSGTGGGTESTAAPSADAAVSSPSGSTPKPPLATPKPASGTGTPPATDKPSATAHVSPTPSPAATQSPHKDEVTLSVVGDSDTGTILAPAAVELKKGDSVLDVLKRATRSRKMQMEYSGGGAASYVEGIDNLYEFDKGAKSGWLFRVNGEFPGVSAGAYKLKAGDTVEWLYTLDMGKDVGKGADDKENAS